MAPLAKTMVHLVNSGSLFHFCEVQEILDVSLHQMQNTGQTFLIQRHSDQSRYTKLQFELVVTIYRFMWREREYKYLPQYYDEKY
jgi:hypothetical protein